MKSLKVVLMLVMSMVSGFFLTGCKKNANEITIAEVAHSIFYVPQYVALEKGFFEEEGLKVNLINANGADKVMAALLSGDVEIGLMGPEASIYVYNGGQENYVINFAQLTKRDGSFLVSKTKIENFTFDMLKGKEVLGGRKGGVPEMTLEYTLKAKGLLVARDDESIKALEGVNVRTDIAFAAMAGAFTSGEGDYTTLFEPTATLLEKSGKGFVVASIGRESGEIPYTAYSATKNYIENNKEIIEKFTRAIYKAQEWTLTAPSRKIAEAISPHFIETEIDDLITVIDRYRSIDAWCKNPYFSEASLNKLMEVMELAEELEKRAPYEKIVDTSFALKVIGN